MLRRSEARWRVDPKLIVQKRLPWMIRRQQAQQQQLVEEVRHSDAKAEEEEQTPAVVVQMAQAAKQRRKSSRLWANLFDQALMSQGELSALDKASILSSMADSRYRHNALLDECIRSLSHQVNVKATVSAMMAVDRLGVSTEALRAPFTQQLSGRCEELAFPDLRRILMALATCWHNSSIRPDLLEEICTCMAIAAQYCDPRDLVAIPQYLGRVKFPHVQLLEASSGAITSVIASRLAVVPLDSFRAMDGYLLLKPLAATAHAQERLQDLAVKCKLWSAGLLSQPSLDEVWKIGSQLLGARVEDARVWSVWTREVVTRREEGESKAKRVAAVRRRIAKNWGMPNLPEGLEIALRAA